MFNFLKKKGKEKSNFFDNKIVSTPKSSKIFRKFVQSDSGMGQSNSSDKPTNKKSLNKSESKDEEYNTAPNSPEIEKCNLLADSFLAIDDDSEHGSSDSLLQNKNQVQNKPDSPSPSTSNGSKPSQSAKPSALLKNTPDAFYNKKINNANKKDALKAQINGSQSENTSNNNSDESQVNYNNVQHNASSIRRNSDTIKQVSPNNTSNNITRLNKQNSADSIQNNSGNNSKIIKNGIFNNNTVIYNIDDSINDQTSVKSNINKPLFDHKPLDKNDCVIINTYSNNTITHPVFEKERNYQVRNVSDNPTKQIHNSISRNESVESVSESASIVVKSQKNTPGFNKALDADDSDTSVDSHSITASFEIKEALPDCGIDEKETNGANEELDETISISIETEEQNKLVGVDLKETNESKQESCNPVENGFERNETLNNTDLTSINFKTENINFDSQKEQEESAPLEESNSIENCLQDNLNKELNLKDSKRRISDDHTTATSMCLSENSDESKCEIDDIVREKSTEQSEKELKETTEDSKTESNNQETKITEEELLINNDVSEVEQSVTTIDTDLLHTEVHKENESEGTKSNLEEEEEEEEEEESESEEESEEDDTDDNKEEVKDNLEDSKLLKDPGTTDVTQNMEEDVASVEPKKKVKKFVRFALIHNTYHGSDTESEEEEEEDDDDDEEEESEEEEEEEEEGEQEVKEEATASKMEEDKPIDNVQVPKPVDIVQEPEVPNLETVEPIIAETETQTDPFESEKSEYENRIQALLSEKSEFEDRIHNLISDLELKQLELNQLKGKIGELENQVLTKTWAMDRQEAEMTSAVKESEHVRQKLRRLEAELTEFRLKNSDLTEELVRKIAEENKRKEDACDFFKIRELEEKLFDANEKIKALEEELNGIKRNQEGAKEAEKIKKAETEVEMKIMREALDEALKQKSILQKRFESEFNQLRNVNTAQEQQLLDDFEWKLREVEQSCKKKILEAEKSKRELEAQVAKLTSEVEELSKFKNVEAELAQLRTVSHEHQRTIRTITRQKEELQVNEKILNEELSRLRASLEKEKTHITTLQAIHSREITEKNRKHQFKLEQQKNELQEQFEERLKKETLRAKVECEKHHLEDKRVAIEHTRTQAETKLQEQKKKWEKQLQDAQRQVEVLRDKLKESERLHRQEVESAQTHSDQSMLELRRKFDKLDMSYQEQIEKAQERHEQEIEHLNEEYERRLGQVEASWQQQLSTTRTTLELVKEQMRRDSYDQVQHLKTQHQRELEEQWSRLIQERDDALAELEQRHRSTIEQLRTEIEIRSKKSHAEAELKERVKQLEQDLQARNMLIANLQSSLQTSSATSSQPQQQQSIVAVIESPGLEDESCLVVSTQSPHSPGLDFQHSLALVFIIFVLISYFLDTFIFPFILCILMLISCVL